jgi:hypothetical protein
MNQTPKVEKKVWTVKCLRETFVPQGALLLGPDIKSEDRVVNSEYVDQLEQDKKDLIDALKFYERGDHIKDQGCETYVGKCPQDVDHGSVAREALTKMRVSL